MKTAFLVACYIFGKLLFQDECWKDSVYATEFSSKVFLYVFILLAIACFIYSIIFAIACFIYSIIFVIACFIYSIIFAIACFIYSIFKKKSEEICTLHYKVQYRLGVEQIIYRGYTSQWL